MQILWEQCLDSKLSDDQRLKRLQALEIARTQRNVKPDGDLAGLVQLTQSKNESITAIALRLGAYWRHEPSINLAYSIARDTSKPIAIRYAAFDAIASTKTVESQHSLRELAENEKDRTTTIEVIVRLIPHRLEFAVELLKNFLGSCSEVELSRFLPPLLQTKDGPQSLTKALANVTLPPCRQGRHPHRPLHRSGASTADRCSHQGRQAHFCQVGSNPRGTA